MGPVKTNPDKNDYKFSVKSALLGKSRAFFTQKKQKGTSVYISENMSSLKMGT